MKREKTQQFNIVVNGSETKSISNRFVSETYLNLQANPAAMSRSMNSGEHVTLKRFQYIIIVCLFIHEERFSSVLIVTL